MKQFFIFLMLAVVLAVVGCSQRNPMNPTADSQDAKSYAVLETEPAEAVFSYPGGALVTPDSVEIETGQKITGTLSKDGYQDTTVTISIGYNHVQLQVATKTPVDSTKVGYLVVNHNETTAGAGVYVDGDFTGWLGHPELRDTLVVGGHNLKVARDGYQDFVTYFEVTENQPVTFNPTLVPIVSTGSDSGAISISSDPAGAWYFVANAQADTIARGVTPENGTDIIPVPLGEYSVRVGKNGYKTHAPEKIQIQYQGHIVEVNPWLIPGEEAPVDPPAEEVDPQGCFTVWYEPDAEILRFEGEIFGQGLYDTLMVDGSTGPMLTVVIHSLPREGQWYLYRMADLAYEYSQITFRFGPDNDHWYHEGRTGCDPSLGNVEMTGDGRWFKLQLQEEPVTPPIVDPPPTPTTGFVIATIEPAEAGGRVFLNDSEVPEGRLNEVLPGTYKVAVKPDEGWQCMETNRFVDVEVGDTVKVVFNLTKVDDPTPPPPPPPVGSKTILTRDLGSDMIHISGGRPFPSGCKVGFYGNDNIVERVAPSGNQVTIPATSSGKPFTHMWIVGDESDFTPVYYELKGSGLEFVEVSSGEWNGLLK